MSDLTYIRLPADEKLLDIEKNSRKNGSGITYDDLIGIWKLNKVWKPVTNKFDNISSTILQLLNASLELKIDKENERLNRYIIKNSIKFGLLDLSFSGYASLKSKQPLLYFYFDHLRIKLGFLSIISKSLPKTDKINMPFFALNALGKNKNWLSARGKGGGLALWLKDRHIPIL